MAELAPAVMLTLLPAEFVDNPASSEMVPPDPVDESPVVSVMLPLVAEPPNVERLS